MIQAYQGYSENGRFKSLEEMNAVENPDQDMTLIWIKYAKRD